MANLAPPMQHVAQHKQKSLAPTRKVLSGGLAGAAALIIVWVSNTYLLPAGKPIPPEVASALTTVLSFLVAYIVPPDPDDQVVLA